MVDSLFSPSWYRVADLVPRLRSHVEIHRHEYRDRIWYILQDHVSGRSQRFSPAVYKFIGLMDGTRTVQQLWDAVTEEAGDQAPAQDEVIRLLGQLHSADALITDATPIVVNYSGATSAKSAAQLSNDCGPRWQFVSRCLTQINF
ncbi:PqqD family protein [Oceanicoccus sagamiensis]|uniref:PqqD family protein n=1 Tax=Oceanicoccus sagamiensis TaxID=716816 RepID=UPI000A2685EA|nr:PqqD family protein [Oceanicoccus sagamiensis]